MYLSKEIGDAEQIKDALSKGEGVSGVYCICVRNKGSSLMEIIQTEEILKKQYIKEKYLIIGLAGGKDESFELTKKIIEDYYNVEKNLNGFKESFWQRPGLLLRRDNSLSGGILWLL